MITSPNNPRVKLIQSLSRRRNRYRQQQMVVEGSRLVQDAFGCGFAPDLVLYTAEWAAGELGQRLLPDLDAAGAPCLLVSDPILASCAATQSPQGVVAVFAFPALEVPADPHLVLIVDRLRIPGNLGTILRTAAAAGVELVLLPPGNVDPYNDKVVRGGMGAHFRLPILQAEWAEVARRVAGLDVWLAAAGEGTPYDRVDWTRPVALIVGGEARGAGDEAGELIAGAGRGGSVCIPMPGQTESLNAAVAAGILLFEALRQRRAASA